MRGSRTGRKMDFFIYLYSFLHYSPRPPSPNPPYKPSLNVAVVYIYGKVVVYSDLSVCFWCKADAVSTKYNIRRLNEEHIALDKNTALASLLDVHTMHFCRR